MAWFCNKTWLRCIFLITALVAFVQSDQVSEEKSHCTADSCEADEVKNDVENVKDESESGIHLAYDCATTNFASEEEAPVIMLHGLSDVRKTWDGIYQNIPVLTHRKACVYDARNHGDSGWNNTFTGDVLVEDLELFLERLKIKKAVLVGHSMGGLTAMKFALKNPEKVDGLFIEDMSPTTISKDAFIAVGLWLHLLQRSLTVIPDGADETTAKKSVVDYITEIAKGNIPESFIRDLPVHQRDGTWQWKANMAVISKLDDSFIPKMEGQYDGKALFIYGKDSPFKVVDHKENIRKLFPKSKFVGVEKAGHIIHSYRSEFVRELIKFLD